MEANYRSPVRAAFDAAARLKGADRQRFLEECDPAIRTEVENLLRASDNAGNFIEQPAVPGLGAAAARAWGEARPAQAASDVNLVNAFLQNRYRVEGVLGSGGFGTVYLARDVNLDNKQVVIKALRRHEFADEWLENHFRLEIKALARIDHPGVVGILDAGALEDGRPFLVMHYVPGPTLRETMKAGPVPPQLAIEWIEQIGDALDAAHSQGVLHRDLKPENIILKPVRGGRQQAVIIDFGIASVLEPDKAEPVVTLVAGSQSYMAPEQRFGRPCAGSDLYALGLIAKELLAGGLDQELPPGASPAVAECIRIATAGSAADRYPTARQFGDALKEAWARPQTRWRRSRKAVLVAIPAGLAAVAAGIALWLWRLPEPSRPGPKTPPAVDVVEMFRGTRPGSAAAPKTAAAVNHAYFGVTVWRLGPPVELETSRTRMKDDGARRTTPVRMNMDSALVEGDRVRISIESGRSGYLYVFDRDDFGSNRYGPPHMIFPVAGIRNNDNHVASGRLIDLPDWEDTPNYFELRRSGREHIGEQIIVLLSPHPVPGLEPADEPKIIPLERFLALEKQWSTRFRKRDESGTAGRPQTAAERAAASGRGSLTSEDPPPQTVFEIDAKPSDPVMFSFLLRIA